MLTWLDFNVWHHWRLPPARALDFQDHIFYWIIPSIQPLISLVDILLCLMSAYEILKYFIIFSFSFYTVSHSFYHMLIIPKLTSSALQMCPIAYSKIPIKVSQTPHIHSQNIISLQIILFLLLYCPSQGNRKAQAQNPDAVFYFHSPSTPHT